MKETKINGKPMRQTWGAYLTEGSINALLTPPGTKAYVSNESRLEHGKRTLRETASGVALTRLQSRDVSLLFAIEGTGHQDIAHRLSSLIEELTAKTTELSLAELPDMTFRIDYLSCTSLTQTGGRLGLFSLKFNEPNPANRARINYTA